MTGRTLLFKCGINRSDMGSLTDKTAAALVTPTRSAFEYAFINGLVK